MKLEGQLSLEKQLGGQRKSYDRDFNIYPFASFEFCFMNMYNLFKLIF